MPFHCQTVGDVNKYNLILYIGFESRNLDKLLYEINILFVNWRGDSTYQIILVCDECRPELLFIYFFFLRTIIWDQLARE